MTATRSWQEAVICSDRYEVRGEVGKGGMARVYRAWDRTLECEVVLKVPHRALLEEEEFAERFTREIRSLVALSHPHIVRVTDVGRHDGVPFAVMQYLGGGSLRERRFADRSPATLDSWLPDIAAALDFMHARGYLHRDVKPANILFDEHGHAYLSDFGIAKALQAEGGQRRDRSLTNPGQAMGTPDYLAPEIILGKEVDGRADQYALAVTVYEWLSGRCPFDGPTPSAVFVQHSTEAPPPLQTFAPHLSPGLCAAVHKGLAKKPEERFPSCQAFVQALLDAPSTDVPPQAPSPAVGEEPVRLPCPRCGKSLRVPPETAGRRVQCPGCKASLKVDENRSSLRSVADRTDTAPFFGANTPTPLIARPAESLTPAGPSTPKPPIVPVDGQRLHGRLLAGAVLAVVVGLPLCIAAVVFSKRSGDSSVALEPRPSPTSPSLADATPKASPSGTSALPLPPAPPKTTGTGGARPLATPSATAVAATRQPAQPLATAAPRPTPTAPRPVPKLTQVLLSAPEGMRVFLANEDGRFPAQPTCTAPGRLNLQLGVTYRLKITDLKGRPGVELYPSLTIMPETDSTRSLFALSQLEVTIRDDELDDVLQGKFLRKPIRSGNVKNNTTTETVQGGAILALLLMGNRDLETSVITNPAKTLRDIGSVATTENDHLFPKSIQIGFVEPEGAAITTASENGPFDDDDAVEAPARLNLKSGVYKLKIANLPGRPSAVIHATLTIRNVSTLDDGTYLAYQAIAVGLTEDECDRIMAGDGIKKAFYRPNDYRADPPYACSDLTVRSGLDPVVAAESEGSVIAVLTVEAYGQPTKQAAENEKKRRQQIIDQVVSEEVQRSISEARSYRRKDPDVARVILKAVADRVMGVPELSPEVRKDILQQLKDEAAALD